MSNNNEYLALTNEGKNAWWRYVAGFVLIVIIWAVGSTLLTVPFIEDLSALDKTPLGFAASLLGFAPILLAVWLVTVLVHRRKFGSLIGPAGRLNWQRIITAFVAWMGLMAVATVIEAAIYGSYTLNGSFLQSWPFVLLALLLLPIQTSAEEFFFRGYLLQATGRLTRNWGVLSAINGVLFVIPHLANPEASSDPLTSILAWFVFGAVFTLFTLRSGSLDYALGIHAANNITLSVVFGYEGGALPANALFVTSEIHGAYGLISLIIVSVVLYWLLFRPRKAAPRTEAPSHA
ncbi:MAG: hypothetical protein KatS3mg053_1149 [Candidatus Roseilinea sp.]|nr:MAG: hypothetical protein KatS3mg053_1149 [Candidatus Roseilinea sp.]